MMERGTENQAGGRQPCATIARPRARRGPASSKPRPRASPSTGELCSRSSTTCWGPSPTPRTSCRTPGLGVGRAKEVTNARATLRIAVNQALSRLRRARRNRETYVGPWLPSRWSPGPTPPSAERAEAVSLAMLVVLGALTPLERTPVFVLHEVFGYEHAEIAAIWGAATAALVASSPTAPASMSGPPPRYQRNPSSAEGAPSGSWPRPSAT